MAACGRNALKLFQPPASKGSLGAGSKLTGSVKVWGNLCKMLQAKQVLRHICTGTQLHCGHAAPKPTEYRFAWCPFVSCLEQSVAWDGAALALTVRKLRKL